MDVYTLFKTFSNLFDRYYTDAFPFFILHLGLLLFFLYRAVRSWFFLRRDLRELKDKSNPVPGLLDTVEASIKEHKGEGREIFIRGLEESILEKVNRNTEPLRLLGSSFIAVGLLGTLFALFQMSGQLGDGQTSNTNRSAISNTSQSAISNTNQLVASAAIEPKAALDKNRELVTRMSIAFSSSFFGLLLSLFCSIVLLKPLRVQVSLVSSEVRKRMALISKENPVNTPEQSFTEAVNEMKSSVASFRDMLGRMEKASDEHNKTSIGLFKDFTDTTTKVLDKVSTSVEQSGTEMKASGENLAKKVTESLDKLEKTFTDISENLQKELAGTITSSKDAADRLTKSSEALSITTADVSESLNQVRDALENTKSLPEIVDKVETMVNKVTEVTDKHLAQTKGQVDIFEKSIENTVTKNQEALTAINEAASSISLEWSTTLEKQNEIVAGNLKGISEAWSENVLKIGDNFFTRLEEIKLTLDLISGVFEPGKGFVEAMRDLRIVMEDASKNALDGQKDDAENEVMNRLTGAVDGLERAIMAFPVPKNHDGLLQGLEIQVRETHALLLNLVESPVVPQEAPAPVARELQKKKERKTKISSEAPAGGMDTPEPVVQTLPLPQQTPPADPPEIPLDPKLVEPESPPATLSPEIVEEQNGETATDTTITPADNGSKPTEEVRPGKGNLQGRVTEFENGPSPPIRREPIPPPPSRFEKFKTWVGKRLYGPTIDESPDTDESKPE
jgi:hypothetical protein